jgi:transposase
MGEDMAVDEKQIDKEMFTILSNRKTGKIALMAETLKVKELLSLTDKFGNEKRWAVKTVTCDLSPSYHWFIRQAFICATPIADKFHIIKHALDYLNDHRIRLKQTYLNEWRSICEKEERKVQHLKLQNGDTTLELLSRSRYILFKREKDWTYTQKQRSVLLFKTYPQLHEDYLLIISFRDWYDKSNIGKETSLITQQLLNWYEEVNAKASDEIKNFKEMIEDHQAKIIPYFKEGKTNAQAENLNKRIQSFIQSNYGVRDKDFFLWRCKQYFS